MPRLRAAPVVSTTLGGAPNADAAVAATPLAAGRQPQQMRRSQPSKVRTVLLVPRGVALDVHALRTQLLARPAAERATLCHAATMMGENTEGLVAQLLGPGSDADVQRYLRYLAPVLRPSMHLLAAYLGGRTAAMDDVIARRDRPHLLVSRGLRAWQATSRAERAAFLRREPGAEALVRALDELGRGGYSVDASDYETTLRFLLLALLHGGLSGLGATVRAMSHAGEVHLRLGRHFTAPRQSSGDPLAAFFRAGPAVEHPLPGQPAPHPAQTKAEGPSDAVDQDNFWGVALVGRLLPLSAERTALAADPPTRAALGWRNENAQGPVMPPPTLCDAEAADALLALRGR